MIHQYNAPDPESPVWDDEHPPFYVMYCDDCLQKLQIDMKIQAEESSVTVSSIDIACKNNKALLWSSDESSLAILAARNGWLLYPNAHHSHTNPGGFEFTTHHLCPFCRERKMKKMFPKK